MDLQKKSFIKPAESCPHRLKTTLWKELEKFFKKTCYLKKLFPNMLANTSLDFISDMGVTDRRHYDPQYRK